MNLLTNKIGNLNALYFQRGIHVFFFIVFAAISFLNHYFFRSAALDYGLSNQALYQFAHFKPAITSMLLSYESAPYLSCHLSFWVPLLSPFYWIFGSYTLLIFQNLALVFAGFGLVKLGRHFGISEWLLCLVLIQFYASFAIYGAVSFDYHDNVVGACFLPWLFYYFIKENWKLTMLCFLAVLISKENMAILLGFISIAFLLIKPRGSVKSYLIPIGFFVLSLTWFMVSSFIVIPALNNTGTFDQIGRYSHLGSNLKEILTYIFTHPIKMFRMFFESHIQSDPDEKVKMEFLKVLFISGGIALIRKPVFLWIALPILIQKLWNKELGFWGLSYHYQIELAPIIGIAILFWLKDIKINNLRTYLLLFLAISTIGITYRKMENKYCESKPINENLFLKAHYQASFDVKRVSEGLKTIPEDAAVCAQANLLPHLATRNKAYHFPILRDANYLVVLEPGMNNYPLSETEAKVFMDTIRADKTWREDSTYLPLRIFKK